MGCFDHDWIKAKRHHIPFDVRKDEKATVPVGPEGVGGKWLGFSHNQYIGSGTRFDYWEAEDGTIWFRAKEVGKDYLKILLAY